MKHFILFTVIILHAIITIAQPKIMVVTPSSGNSRLAPTLDSAYSLALSGDDIYIPTGVYSITKIIQKKLRILGNGINPDSSLKGITTINSTLFIGEGSDTLYIEGIKFSERIYFGFNSDPTSAKVNGITFQRCDINYVGNFTYYQLENSPRNISFYECALGNVLGTSSENWLFVRSIITFQIINLTNSNFLNCIFYNYTYPISQITYSIFSNNIFYNGSNVNTSVSNCMFQNNYGAGDAANAQNSVINNITANGQVFVGTNLVDPWYKIDFHLLPTSGGISAGTDGTDIGIYGTSQPTKPGWIPSNPHIYYKSVGNQNDANGILHATFKVKPQIY